MLRTCSLLLAGLAWTASSLPAQAQDDESRALIREAIKAHGGKDALRKHLGAQVKYKGTVDTMGMTVKVEGEVFTNHPDRMKNVINVEVNNMNFQVQQGFDGKVLWLSVMGMNKDIDDKEALTEIQESFHAERVANLFDLDNKEFKLASLGEMKIKDKDAVGVRVSKEGKRDVNLWFDKASHMLVKSEYRGKDPFGQTGEVNQEKYFSNYKSVMGVQTPMRLEVHNDGKKMLDLEISEVRYHERLDDTYFTKP
jgi:hypothetical protein